MKGRGVVECYLVDLGGGLRGGSRAALVMEAKGDCSVKWLGTGCGPSGLRVLTGERNSSESDRMQESIRPAMSFGGTCNHSRHVHREGTNAKGHTLRAPAPAAKMHPRRDWRHARGWLLLTTPRALARAYRTEPVEQIGRMSISSGEDVWRDVAAQGHVGGILGAAGGGRQLP